MSFVDKVNVNVLAGRGGDGKLSFRREKFISKGGPNGGDGGNGGDVVLEASRNQNTLAAFRYQKEIKAENGQPGGKSNKHGKSAKPLIVKVPIGTMATSETGQILADLTEDGQQAIIARGGKGGFGNAHFVSSVRQAPSFAEKGEPGEKLDLVFELKMIADVGLVGLPNAGKSTLLGRISNAKPEVANYPFTTLVPNLGVVDIDNSSVLFADIPGIIEGASSGKGLGHDFLRHVERTAVILHLIDSYNEDVATTYQTIREELKAYSEELAKRPELILLTKVEGLDDEIISDLIAQLKRVKKRTSSVMAISSHSGQGLQQMLFTVKELVNKQRQKEAQKTNLVDQGLPILTIEDQSDAWQVKKMGKKYVVTGPKIEKFAIRTNFQNPEGVQRLRHIMQKVGIMHELSRQGIEPGQVIQIGDDSELSFKY